MKKLISETFELFIKNINSLILIYFPFLLLSSLISYFQKKSDGIFVYYLYAIVQLLIESFFTPMLIIFLSLALFNRAWNYKDLFIRGLVFVPKIFLISLILFFPFTIFPYVQEYVGVIWGILFVVIAFFIALKLLFSSYLIVLENNKLFKGIKNSFYYTSNYIGKIFLLLIIVGIPLAATQLIASILIEKYFAIYAIKILIDEFLIEIISLLLPIGIFKIYCLDYFQRNETID